MNEKGPKALTADEIKSETAALEGWKVDDGKLVKTFEFDDFKSAVKFVDRLTEVAEEMGHHPDLRVGWGKVTAELSTHSVGGISDADIALARGIDGRAT